MQSMKLIMHVTKPGHTHSSNTVNSLEAKEKNTDNSKLNQHIIKFNKR